MVFLCISKTSVYHYIGGKMDKDSRIRLTSFRLTGTLHAQLKIMCVLTGKSMGEFIRISIRDKIKSLKVDGE